MHHAQLIAGYSLNDELPLTSYQLRSFEDMIASISNISFHQVDSDRILNIQAFFKKITNSLNIMNLCLPHNLLIVSIDKFFFEINGKISLCLYGVRDTYIPLPLFLQITDYEIAVLLVYGELVKFSNLIDNIKISRSEFIDCIEASAFVNLKRPSYGISSRQKNEFIEKFDNGIPVTEVIKLADIVPIITNRVETGLVHLIAQKCLLRVVDINPRLKNITNSAFHNVEPVKVDLISFGSPWHHALWNILSVEALKGDLVGEFQKNVDVCIHRAILEQECFKIIDDLIIRKPDIIGLSIELGTLSAVDVFMKILSGVTFSKPPIIVLGNQVPTYFPEKFLTDTRFKNILVCLHEGEFVMRKLVQIVRSGGSYSDLPNIVFRDTVSDFIIRTPLQNLDVSSLIHPPSLDTCHPGITNMIQTSRGCIFGCTYCTRWSSWNASSKLDAVGEIVFPNASTKWRPFALERVLENIEQFISYDINELEICDDEFFGGVTPRALERVALFCDIIEGVQKKYECALTYRIFTTPLIIARSRKDEKAQKTNAIVLTMLKRLVSNGLVRVYIGLESGDKNQKERYDRRESIDDTIMALKILRELGLEIDIGFIMFDPYLTTDELLNNVNFFRTNQLVKNNTWPFRPLVVNEGTVMKRQLEKDGLLTGECDPEFLSYGYRFLNEDISIIADAVQSLARESAPVFYTLKTISKAHWERQEGSSSQLAQEIVEENALVYLDLMEYLARSEGKVFDVDTIDMATFEARRRILKLINQVTLAFNAGLFDSLEKDKMVLARHIVSFWRMSGHLYKILGVEMVLLDRSYSQELASDDERMMALNDL